MQVDPKAAAGRAFVRSLNVLLKFARLYGFEHARTSEQLDVAWRELRAAIPLGTDSGLLLGATGSELLLDGVPLEGSPAEKQFAHLLSSAGLASVQFFPSITQEELGRFAHAFPTGKAKPSELAPQLKAALVGMQGIRTNEICFVATDSRLKEASVAAQLAAATLGDDQDQFRKMLNDPHKLLELIAAAQGSQAENSAAGSGGGSAGSGSGDGAGFDGGDTIGTGTGLGFGTGHGSVSGSGTGYRGAGYDSGATASGPGSGTGSAGSVGGGLGSSSGSGIGVGAGGATGGTGGAYSDGYGSGAGLRSSTLTGLAQASVGIGSGSRSPGFGPGPGEGFPGGPGSGFGHGTGRGGAAPPTEDEIYGILNALTSFGKMGAEGGGLAAASAFQTQLSELSGRAQDTLKQAIAALAAQAPEGKTGEAVVVQLAEHLAIRFALERYERGEVKVNAVRQMLDRMNDEIENLRRILGAHEEKMTDAEIMVESHREILDRQFWAAVPDSGKEAVLLSEEAWCIPPRNVQSYVGDLIEKGEVAQAVSILQNYASCAGSDNVDARRKTAVGLSEMAELYARADPGLLGEAMRHLGVRLSVEQDNELQGLVSAAFVRLSQQAATSRCFAAMEQALDLIAGVESQRPGIARSLRGKMGIEERVPDFIEEALRSRQVAAGLTKVLQQLPQTAMEQLAARFNRCTLRDDAEHVANLAHDLGEEGAQYLRSTIRGGPVNEAVEICGLLSKLDPQALEVFLPSRLKDFPRTSQDRIVRQISAASATGRCRVLLAVLDHVDPLVMPLVIDEIGVTADREALGRLLTVADGDLPAGAGPYLRVKAVESLGRIHAPETITTLRRILESRKMFGWVHPQELRIAAMQALEKLEPEWAHSFLPASGLEKDDLALAPLEVVADSKFVRQRRHTRVRLARPVTAIITNLKENCRLEIKTASLTGGVATIDRHLAPGTQVQLRFQLGLRNLQATAMLRDYRAQDMAFEIVDMNLEERSRYRRLLSESLNRSSDAADAHAPAEPTVTR